MNFSNLGHTDFDFQVTPILGVYAFSVSISKPEPDRPTYGQTSKTLNAAYGAEVSNNK